MPRLRLLWALALFGAVAGWSGAAAAQVPDDLIPNGNWYRNGTTLDLDFYNNRYWLNGNSYSFINDFLNGAGTFTRNDTTANATYFNSSGTLVTAASGAVRPNYTYNGSSWVYSGDLLEESRTNLVAYSSNLTGTNWVNNGSGYDTLNQTTTAPDGSLAYSIAATAQYAGYWYYWHPAANTTYAISAFVKNVSGGSKVQLGSDSNCWGPNNYTADLTFDTVAGTFSAIGGGVTNYSALPLKNGWWRVSIVATTNSTVPGAADIDNYPMNGSSSSENAFWGNQIEVGYFPTSYIPTSGSTATRAGESFSEFSRAGSGTATYFNSSGVLTVANANAPRLDHSPISPYQPLGVLIEESRTNSIRDDMMVGAVASSSTQLVTNGSFSGCSGSTCSGWSTTVNEGSGSVSFASGVATLTGDGTNAASIYQPITTTSGYYYTVTITNGSGNAVTVQVGTVAGGATLLAASTVAAGVTKSYQFQAVGTTSYVQINNSSTTAANVTTTSVQSAGEVPTDWSANANQGINISVVGSGLQNGISYVDLNFAGTATSNAATPVVFFDASGSSGIAASNGQAWDESAYLAVTSGSLPAGIVLGWYVYNGNSYVTSQQLGTETISSSLSRYNLSGTIAISTTTNIEPYFYVYVPSGDTINANVRVGMPQLELGAFPTSVIPTSGSAVTRNADQFGIGTSAAGANGAWYTAGQGTLLANGMMPYLDSSGTHRFVEIDDGTLSNIVTLSASLATDKAAILNGSSTVYSQNALSTVASSLIKGGIAYSSNVYSAFSGTAYASGSGISIPAMTELCVGAGAESGCNNYPLDGWVNRVTYFQSVQPNASLPGYTH